MLRRETVELAAWYKGIKELSKRLDPTNVKILSSMHKYGPRNLLEISRRTGIPFTSVYHRVAKLEAKSGRIAYLIPQLSRLGLVEVVVLAAAKPGLERAVRDALKLPNFWWSVNSCEGPFTHHSVHAVPVKLLTDFRKYVREIARRGLITQSRILLTGDYIPNFPDFRYYSPAKSEWMFEWSRWLAALKKASPVMRIRDPESYSTIADKKDLIIVKELEKNARRSFADLSPILGISLQGVKYHYDKKLLPSGIVKNFNFDIVPYSIEVSAYHEVMLEFPNTRAMDKFTSIVDEFFFVIGLAKVLRQNKLLVRTYMLQTQVRNMFTFFSEMAKAGLLENYSAVRLDFAGREKQTISYELYEDKKGWTFNLKKCVNELRKISPN